MARNWTCEPLGAYRSSAFEPHDVLGSTVQAPEPTLASTLATAEPDATLTSTQWSLPTALGVKLAVKLGAVAVAVDEPEPDIQAKDCTAVAPEASVARKVTVEPCGACRLLAHEP